MDKALTVTKVHIIRFGGVSQQIFTFKDGLNIIYGENRSGKTTLCEFIRFMYYGFEGRDAEDFYPYNFENRSVCGSMTFKFGQKTYEIFREQSNGSSVLVITDTEKSLPYQLPENTSPGEHFLGISSFLYDRSLYCPQDMAGIVSTGNLIECEKELISAYSGEDSFLSVAPLLEQHKDMLSNSEKTGEVDLCLAEREVLEGELSFAVAKQNEIINMETQIDQVTKKLLDVEKQIVLAKADIEGFHEMQVEQNSRRIENVRKEMENAKEDYERLLNSGISASEAQTARNISSRYKGLQQLKQDLEALEEQISASKTALDSHNDMVSAELFTERDFEKTAEKFENRELLSRILMIVSLPVLAVATIVFATVFLFRGNLPGTQIVYFLCGVFGAVSAGTFLAGLILYITRNSVYRAVDAENAEDFETAYELCRSHTQSQAIFRSAYEQDKRIYEEKSAEYIREMNSLSAELDLGERNPDPEKLSRAVAEKCIAEEKIEAARKRYESAIEEYENLGTSDFIAKVEKDVEQLHIREKELAWLNSQHEEFFEKKRSLESTFSTAVIHNERPAYIKTRLNRLVNRITEGYKDLTAISIALHITEDALKVMRFHIQQHLADGVKNAIKFALKEDEAFLLDDSYSLQYKNSSRIFPVFSDNISRSVRTAKGISRSLSEMAAIALRISLSELLETDCAPAVMDEPFAFIDSIGEEKLLNRIEKSKANQTLLFTSRKIPDPQEKYNIINM